MAWTPSPTCTPRPVQNRDLATSQPTFVGCHHERSEGSAFSRAESLASSFRLGSETQMF